MTTSKTPLYGYRDSKTKIEERLKGDIRSQVYGAINPKEIIQNVRKNPSGVRRDLRNLTIRIIGECGYLCTTSDREALVEYILNEILGFGPIEPLLRDESVAEVMVNGPDKVFVEREGKLELTAVTFDDEEHVMRIIDRIVSPIGRRIDESCPMVNGRLADGSRINAIIRPVSLVGPVLTVRKFRSKAFTLSEMVVMGCLSEAMMEMLRAAVRARLNVIVTGGTGSGKTTLLNALSREIPADERIVTIEDAAELKFEQPHVVSLEARPANIEGRGSINIRDLVINALRMRPDRIVVGEVRSGECLDMLQAMNTGHDGSLTTAHANSPTDVIVRLETMALMSGLDLPVSSIRQQIAAAIDLIVHETRSADGSRRVTNIAEISGGAGDELLIRDIFAYVPGPAKSSGHLSTGYVPRCAPKLAEQGFCVTSSGASDV